MTKLPKGTLKIISPLPEAARENEQRRRNGGRTFVPTWIVYVIKPDGVNIIKVYSFAAKSFTPNDVGRAPLGPWASPQIRKTLHMWLETTDELTIYTEQEEAE